MSNHWSKIVLVSMLVLALGASLAFGTTTRVRSLANTGDYYSDDSNVHRWYSLLPSYANQINAEVGTFSGFGSLTDTRGLSWTFKAGDYGTYRISLNENQLDMPGLWSANPFFTMFTPGMVAMNTLGPGNPGFPAPGITPINTWDLAGGWDVGENLSVGVNFTRSRWNYEITGGGAADTSASNTWTTAGAGLSWANNEDLAADLAVNVAFAGGSLEGPAGTMQEWDSKTAFDVAGRAFWDWTDNVTVPVTAEFVSAEYSAKTNSGAYPLPNGDKVTAFQAGAGLNVDVNSNNMFVLAVEVGQHKWEFSNPDTNGGTTVEVKTLFLPTIRMALETQVNSWLTTRVGAARHMGNTKTKKNNGMETKTTDGVPTAIGSMYPFDANAFEWFLGLGFTVAEWTIDLELTEEAPFSLGYWLTGYSAYTTGNQGPVGRISAVYNY